MTGTNLTQSDGSTNREPQTTGTDPASTKTKSAKKFDHFGFDFPLTTYPGSGGSSDFALLYGIIDAAEENLLAIIKRRIADGYPVEEIVEFRDVTQLSEMKSNLVMSLETELQRKIAGN